MSLISKPEAARLKGKSEISEATAAEVSERQIPFTCTQKWIIYSLSYLALFSLCGNRNPWALAVIALEICLNRSACVCRKTQHCMTRSVYLCEL